MQSNNQRILHLSHNPLNASAREPTISSTWQAPGHGKNALNFNPWLSLGVS
ncbi:hypothetical protein DPMN_172703 [Dreissena polymorpha]|uniref:Uncharacterized protein n=1 Tax=Dreissena polymorpha TaxID=45954 RepID=A0A9D4E0A9_DREPO|nr:hypothetical protein DPMN_172703 [Dreissena polymorpha]